MWQRARTAPAIDPQGCQIWWASIAYERPEHLSLLDETERGRHAALRQPNDRSRFVLACALERLLLGAHLGEAPERIPIDRTCPDCGKPHGKPRLLGADHRVEFSVSHSGDRVVFAVSLGGPVGVDVEVGKEHLDIEGLASHTLHAREHAAFSALPESDRGPAFLRYWTGKEAVLKATGEGLRAGLKDVVLSPPGDPLRIVAWEGRPGWERRISLHDLHAGSGHVAALAALDHAPASIRELDSRDWLEP